MRQPTSFLTLAIALATLPLIACAGRSDVSDGGLDGVTSDTPAGDTHDANPLADVHIPDRTPGTRAPLTAECDPVDPLRCGLPWPSNAYTIADPSTPTGLRVHASPMTVQEEDSPDSLNRADGFSRLNPVVTGFAAHLDRATLGDGTTASIRILVAQQGASFGQAIPVRMDSFANHSTAQPESLVMAYPRQPFAPNTDYVVVVMDSLHKDDGGALMPSDLTRAALGLKTPETIPEAQQSAYHAPTRALLQQAGIDPAHVLRVWDFTTRSVEESALALETMRAGMIAALADSSVNVVIEEATVPTSGPVAAVVRGHITGLPSYLAADNSLSLDANNVPQRTGVHDAPFRVMIPAGTGNYRVVMYGHGTGGNIRDDSFDTDIAAIGAAKVSLQFTGWTDADVPNTFASFEKMVYGVSVSTAVLLQSLADGMASQHALDTKLGDALAAAMIATTPNPAAGRRPNTDVVMWTGGSLGGTLGLVYSNAEANIPAGVINVPGTAWTHFIPYSNLFSAVQLILRSPYPSDIDLYRAIAMSQLNWDAVDGANYIEAVAPHHPTFLVQESMGDPVLPNPGTEMVAVSLNAPFVGAVLQPILALPSVPEADMMSAITQYRVPATATAALDIHGFGARDTPAGVAARQQIFSFIQSVWMNSPKIIVPPDCVSNTPAGSCDFSNAM